MMSLWVGSALLACAAGIVTVVHSASQALRWERDSLAQGRAVLLAQDLAHRLHLNAATATQYRLDWGQQPITPACRDRPCSRADWAQADLSQWRTHVAQALPDADVWLQASGAGAANPWLVLAWPSESVKDVATASRLPVPCPERKRCLAWVLTP